jgi:hypothetical protein
MASSVTYEIILDTKKVNAESSCFLSLRKIENKTLPRFGRRKIKMKKIVD